MSERYPSAMFVSAFSDYDNWSEIAKQSIFEAWVPFVSDRPIDFFVPTSEDGKEGFLTTVIDDKTPLSEHRIVNTLKRRKVVILTSDELCQNHHISDVLVAKIISVKENQKEQDWYKKHLVNDSHPLYVHLPKEITGEESFVNLAQVMTIGKKLLIEKKRYLPEDRMELVENRLAEYIDLGATKSDHEIASNE